MGNCECGDTKLCGEQESESNDMATKVSVFDEKKHPVLNPLVLKIKTWQKESYSLFDYENQVMLKEQSIQVNMEGLLVRRNNDINWIEGTEFKKQINEVFLFRIGIEDNIYSLMNNRLIKNHFTKDQFDDEENKQELTTKYHNTRKDLTQYQPDPDDDDIEMLPMSISIGDENAIDISQNGSRLAIKQQNTEVFEIGSKIWLVLRSIKYTQNAGLKLKVGDIIKMGRVKFKIKEVNFKNFKDHPQNEIQKVQSLSSYESVEGPNQCRICLQTSTSLINPLVNPCKCAGSMKYIHLECLQTWLRSKLNSRHSEHCIVYMWKNLECELCKSNYPPVFKSDEAYYDLVELSKPKDTPYMLMEITQKKYEVPDNDQGNQNSCSGVYIITFGSKTELKIGRAHETDIRINDISVSRQQACLKIINHEVYVSDTKSKFGTLVLLQQTIPLQEELNGIEIQIGRSVILFQIGQNNQIVDQRSFEKCLKRCDDDDEVIA